MIEGGWLTDLTGIGMAVAAYIIQRQRRERSAIA
jgi:hypothetical protein